MRMSSSDRYLCIGDIHGCSQQLDELLEEVEQADLFNVTYVFLGDYLDRGPDSGGVIDRIRRLPDAICLCGNHEEMFLHSLEAIEGMRDEMRAERRKTFLENQRLNEDHVAWLKSDLRPYHQTGAFFFSHAGLDPFRPLEQQRESDFYWSVHEGDFYRVTEKLVVHGHLTVPRVTIQGNNANVDTGCGKGGKLSALLVPEMRVFESRSRGGSARRW